METLSPCSPDFGEYCNFSLAKDALKGWNIAFIGDSLAHAAYQATLGAFGKPMFTAKETHVILDGICLCFVRRPFLQQLMYNVSFGSPCECLSKPMLVVTSCAPTHEHFDIYQLEIQELANHLAKLYAPVIWLLASPEEMTRVLDPRPAITAAAIDSFQKVVEKHLLDLSSLVACHLPLSDGKLLQIGIIRALLGAKRAQSRPERITFIGGDSMAGITYLLVLITVVMVFGRNRATNPVKSSDVANNK